MPPMTGRVISGRYNLAEPIGRGAMGVVWRARDRLLDRDVAIKEVVLDEALAPDERENAYQRTLREARTAARLSHRGLVTVFDVVEEDGRPWIVMELVISRSLEAMIASDGPLPPRRACRIGQELLAALAAAHAAGVLHRDVKPSNVLIAQEPGTRDGERAVLTDFGIAQFQGDPRLTQTGMVMGSPGFTAPERIRGGSATPASDLWSLGATIYAAVEGHGPYEDRGGPITTMTAIINEDAPYARKGGILAQVVDALLRRNPAARPSASVAARMFAQALPLLPDSPAKPRLVPPRRAETVSPTKPLGATAADDAHPGTLPSLAEMPPPALPANDSGNKVSGKDVPDSEEQDSQALADQASADEAPADEALVADAEEEVSDETPDARAPAEDSASKPVTETEDAEDTASSDAVSGHGVPGDDADDNDADSNDADSGSGSDDVAADDTTVGESADEPVDDDLTETQEDVPGSGSEADSAESNGSEGNDSEPEHAESGSTASAGAAGGPEAGEEPGDAPDAGADALAAEEPAVDSAAEDSPFDDASGDAPASDAVTGHIAPAGDRGSADAEPPDSAPAGGTPAGGTPADTASADTVADDDPADRDLANIPTVVDVPAPSLAGRRTGMARTAADSGTGEKAETAPVAAALLPIAPLLPADAVPPPADPVMLIDRITTEPSGKPGPPAAEPTRTDLSKPARTGPAKPTRTDLTRTDLSSSGYAAAGTGYRTASGYRPGNYQAASGYRPDSGYQPGSYQGQGQPGGTYAPGRPATAAYDPRRNGPGGFPSAPQGRTRKGAGARGGRRPGQTRWRRWAILAAVVVVLAAAIGIGAAFLVQHNSGANASSNTGNSAAQALQGSPLAVQMIDNPAAAPAGWQTTTVSAATTGTTAGFSVTAPADWTVKQSSLATTITAPDGLRYVEVDLTPHHYANMLSEAKYIQNTALSEAHFPGYQLVSLKQATIRGTSGAFWAFTWVRPDGTTMRVNDLIFALQTPAGPQSYAVYLTAPNAEFSGSEGLGIFEKILASFKEVPAQP